MVDFVLKILRKCINFEYKIDHISKMKNRDINWSIKPLDTPLIKPTHPRYTMHIDSYEKVTCRYTPFIIIVVLLNILEKNCLLTLHLKIKLCILD